MRNLLTDVDPLESLFSGMKGKWSEFGEPGNQMRMLSQCPVSKLKKHYPQAFDAVTTTKGVCVMLSGPSVLEERSMIVMRPDQSPNKSGTVILLEFKGPRHCGLAREMKEALAIGLSFQG